MRFSLPVVRRPGWRVAAIGAAAALALAACDPAPEEEPADTPEVSIDAPVRIGALLPMTGDLRGYGESSLNSIRLAVQQINVAGGIHGQEAQMRTGDSATAPETATEAARQLLEVDSVVGIVGALSSDVALAVATEVMREARRPLISTGATSARLTAADDGDYLFRTVPADALQGLALAELALDAGLETVSILHVDNEPGEDIAAAFRDGFTGGGGAIAAAAAYEPGKRSYRGDLSRVAGGDALVLIADADDGITILRQALQDDHFDRFLFSEGMRTRRIIDAIGADILEGAAGTAAAARDDTEAARRFAEDYEAIYAEPPPLPYMDTAYDATFALALAVKAAGTTDGEAVRDQLRRVTSAPGEEILPGQWERAAELLTAGEDVHYTGASGAVAFDDHGDVAGEFAHWVIEDGEIVVGRVWSPAR